MRKSIVLLFMAFMSLAFVPAYANGEPTNPPAVTAMSDPNKEAELERVKFLENRLNEIKAMDRSEMTRAERKALRKEVKEIKSELAAKGNGVYLSVGAIIIIILLLILLL